MESPVWVGWKEAERSCGVWEGGWSSEETGEVEVGEEGGERSWVDKECEPETDEEAASEAAWMVMVSEGGSGRDVQRRCAEAERGAAGAE